MASGAMPRFSVVCPLAAGVWPAVCPTLRAPDTLRNTTRSDGLPLDFATVLAMARGGGSGGRAFGVNLSRKS
jgi:hypothetical protein